MKENEKKYNAIDFARYHSGAMPPDEKHALEKAALEDPFLAETLDGYAYTKNLEKELREIKMRLDEKRKQKNTFPLFSRSHIIWWKIAAMLIVMAGTGYFIFFLNSKNNPLAVKQDVAKRGNPATIFPINSDTTASEGNLAFEKASKEKENNNSLKSPATSARSFTPSIEEAQNKEKKMREEENHAKEKSRTMTVSADKMKSADIALNDSGERSFLRPPDTTALVAASPDVYDSNTGNTIAMNKIKSSLQEVAVTGYGTKKKSRVSRALEGKVSGIAANISSPYLKEGKENFDQYITDNTIPVLDSSGKKLSANILLSFILNNKGTPSHIKVIESSCKPCETEAIRLLKNGPDWVGKRGTSGSVRIRF